MMGPGKCLPYDLFVRVRPVLVKRLSPMCGVTQLDKRYQEEARIVSKLLNIDVEALYQAAVKEIPEPKSWAGLKADGTPKEEKEGKGAAKKKA